MGEQTSIEGCAFPTGHDGDPGLTTREYACVHLCQPETGIEELDDLICKAKRDEIAAKAMQAAISEGALRNIANLIREQDETEHVQGGHKSKLMTDFEIADAANHQLGIRSYAIADAMLAAREGGAS